jgi:hypothetical protein
MIARCIFKMHTWKIYQFFWNVKTRIEVSFEKERLANTSFDYDGNLGVGRWEGLDCCQKNMPLLVDERPWLLSKNMPLWWDHVTSFAFEHSLQHSHNSLYFVMKPITWFILKSQMNNQMTPQKMLLWEVW